MTPATRLDAQCPQRRRCYSFSKISSKAQQSNVLEYIKTGALAEQPWATGIPWAHAGDAMHPFGVEEGPVELP